MVEAAKRYFDAQEPAAPQQSIPFESAEIERAKIEAWFDGACEPNNPGGHGTFGIVVKVDGKTVVARSGYVGCGPQMSNNVAEFTGFMAALAEIVKLPADSPAIIHGDSELVINTLRGEWKAKHGLYIPCFLRAKAMLDPLRGRVSLKWVPREQNEECDALSKDELVKRGVACR